jgi:preprotein translocase subunit SecG
MSTGTIKYRKISIVLSAIFLLVDIMLYVLAKKQSDATD